MNEQNKGLSELELKLWGTLGIKNRNGIDKHFDKVYHSIRKRDVMPIVDMRIGKEGYIVPWALFQSKDGNIYARGWHVLSLRSGGTIDQWVERTEKGLATDIGTIKERISGSWSDEYDPHKVLVIQKDKAPHNE